MLSLELPALLTREKNPGVSAGGLQQLYRESQGVSSAPWAPGLAVAVLVMSHGQGLSEDPARCGRSGSRAVVVQLCSALCPPSSAKAQQLINTAWTVILLLPAPGRFSAEC